MIRSTGAMQSMTTAQAMRQLDRVRAALAKTQDLGKIKNLRDRVEALRTFIQTADLGLAMQNQAAEIKLLAERRAGEVLAGVVSRGGNRNSSVREQDIRLEDLGISRAQSSRWQLEALLPEEEFVQFVRQTKAQGQELTSRRLLTLARIYREAAKVSKEPHNPLGPILQGLRALARQSQRFACIYADLPWPRPGKQKTVLRFIKTLSQLPVQDVAAQQAHLHLRVTPEFMEHGLGVLRAWGFRYRASLVRATLPSDYGPFWRPAHELLLLGVRGSLPFRDNGLTSWIDGGHSDGDSSAEEIRALIERASPAPYLDLFGTTAPGGWKVASSQR